MSLVKVAGNASGTGTITIQAPNTNTNYTLDLPAAAGTIQLSGNAISGTTGTFSGTISGGSTIGVGGATPANTGAGITFPATQSASTDANTLDDYEEGTWTPTDGSGAGLTFTSVVGRYTKIGNQVICWGRLVYPSTANGNNAKISGLPFTTNSSDAVRSGGFITATNNPNNYRIFLENNSTSFPINTNTTGLTTNANNSTYDYYFMLVYFV